MTCCAARPTLRTTQRHRQRIDFRFEANATPVFADEERVLQVLNELVANAIKFSPPGTTIRLAAWNVEANAARADGPEADEVCFIGRGPGPRHCAGEAGAHLRAIPAGRRSRTRARWAERAWGWRCAAALWSSTAGASGRRAKWAREAGSCLRCRRQAQTGGNATRRTSFNSKWLRRRFKMGFASA